MTGNSTSRPRSIVAFVIRGAVAGALLAVAAHAGYILLGSNFRTVLPGQVYRCAQLSGTSLERLIRRHGIRTVVNLRGCCPTAPWYLEEARVTSALGVSLEDIPFSATRLPSVVFVRHLLDVLDRSEYPILFHCHQGADRTGLASALAVLLRTDADVPKAREQLGLRYGHLPFGKPQHIDRFVDLYEEWLTAEGREHTPDVLRDWIRHHYCPREARAELALLEPLHHPEGQPVTLTVAARRPRMMTLRCRNTSLVPWSFTPDSNAGVHVWCKVFDRNERVVWVERVGMFHARVVPGDHKDLLLYLPPLEPGVYQLRIDLSSEQHAHFSQVGNDLYVVELEVS